MIKLKDLLVEKGGQVKLDGKTYPAWTKKVMDYVLKGDNVPLTTGIVDKVLGKKIPVNAFHATDIKNTADKKQSKFKIYTSENYI